MTKSPNQQSVCVESLKLMGDFWTLRIIDALKDGHLRFCELQRLVGNVNPVTLTDRLKKLEDAGLINRTEEMEDKISVDYSLTSMGREALPVIKAINQFSKKIQQQPAIA